jgi:hypothetical protein
MSPSAVLVWLWSVVRAWVRFVSANRFELNVQLIVHARTPTAVPKPERADVQKFKHLQRSVNQVLRILTTPKRYEADANDTAAAAAAPRYVPGAVLRGLSDALCCCTRQRAAASAAASVRFRGSCATAESSWILRVDERAVVGQEVVAQSGAQEQERLAGAQVVDASAGELHSAQIDVGQRAAIAGRHAVPTTTRTDPRLKRTRMSEDDFAVLAAEQAAFTVSQASPSAKLATIDYKRDVVGAVPLPAPAPATVPAKPKKMSLFATRMKLSEAPAATPPVAAAAVISDTVMERESTPLGVRATRFPTSATSFPVAESVAEWSESAPTAAKPLRKVADVGEWMRDVSASASETQSSLLRFDFDVE